MLMFVIQHQPYSAGTDLRRKLVACLIAHGSILSRVGASGKPGAVQYPSFPPKALEAVGWQLGVAHCVLNISVAEVGLHGRISCPALASAKPQACRSIWGCTLRPIPADFAPRSIILAKPAGAAGPTNGGRFRDGVRSEHLVRSRDAQERARRNDRDTQQGDQCRGR